MSIHSQRIFSNIIEPAKIFLISRGLILAILICASQITFFTVPAREGINYNPNISLQSSTLSAGLARIWRSADASWYLKIAEKGYKKTSFTAESPANWVFFPLYPLLTKALGAVTGSYLIAGLVISNLSFFVSLILLGSLAKSLGQSPEQARNAMWLLALFPTSYFFISPLTEALFLALILAAFLALQKDRLIASGVLMMLAAACRPTGLLILPAFALALFEQKKLLSRNGIIALALSPLGALVFMGYLYNLTGNALAWFYNQAAWGRGQGSINTILSSLISNPQQLMVPWNFIALNTAAVLLALWASVILFRRKQLSYTVLILVPLLVPLFTGTLQSACRFSMVLFPIYLVLGTWALNRDIERILVIIFSGLLFLMTALYGIHVTVAMA